MPLFSPSYNKKDALFLAITFFTLCLFATFIALHQDHQAYSAYCQAANHTEQEACKLDKPFMEKLIGDPAAFFTAVLAVLTLILAFVGVAQVVFLVRADETSRISADAAKRSADVARDALIASSRAWLKIDVKTSYHPFIKNPDGGFGFAVDLFAKNVGNAPAINVSPHAWMLTWRDDPGMNPLTLHAKRCEEVRNRSPFYRHLLYPGEEFPHPPGSTFGLGVSISKEDIEASLGPVTNAEGKTGLMIYIGGCFDYSFTSDPDGRHQTQFLLLLEKSPPGPFMIDEDVVSIENLTLRPTAFGPGITVT